MTLLSSAPGPTRTEEQTDGSQPEPQRGVATRTVKQFLALVATGVALALIVGVVVALSLTVTRASTGADPSSALKEIPQIPDGLEDLVQWQADPQLDRPVEPLTRRLVESSWVRAWAQLDIAQQTADPADLDTWFVGDIHGLAADLAAASDGASIEQLSHVLEVTFYSVDGSIMGLSAEAELVHQRDGWPSVQQRETFEVVFLLSDGNWRIKSLTRTGTSPS